MKLTRLESSGRGECWNAVRSVLLDTAKRPDPVHSSMSKEEKRWVAWGTAEGVRVIGVSCTNAIQGWCNLINQGPRETLCVLALEIGMGLLAHLRSDRVVQLSPSASLGVSQGTGASSSIRASPGKHVPVSFHRGAGKDAAF